MTYTIKEIFYSIQGEGAQAGRPAVEECRILTVEEDLESALDLRIWASPVEFGGQPCTFLAAVNIADEKRRAFLERVFLHDILNTATAIRGFSQLLGAGDVDEPDRSQFVGRIDALTNRIVDEIEGHRQLMAAESGALEVRRRPVEREAQLRRGVPRPRQENLAGDDRPQGE